VTASSQHIVVWQATLDIVLALSARRVNNVSVCFVQQAAMSIVSGKGQADTDFRCQKLRVVQHASVVGSLDPRLSHMSKTEALWHVQRTVKTIGHIVMVAHLMHTGSLVCSKSFCDDVQQEILLLLQPFTHAEFITQFLPCLIVCLMQAVAVSIGDCLRKNLDTYTARFAYSLYIVL